MHSAGTESIGSAEKFEVGRALLRRIETEHHLGQISQPTGLSAQTVIRARGDQHDVPRRDRHRRPVGTDQPAATAQDEMEAAAG